MSDPATVSASGCRRTPRSRTRSPAGDTRPGRVRAPVFTSPARVIEVRHRRPPPPTEPPPVAELG